MTLRDALLRGRRRPRIRSSGSPSAFRADGYEFAELREYVPGDDTRRIDWAATARAGALQTRVMYEDVGLTLGAVLDTSASMRVGKQRLLLDSAADALDAWYGVATPDDRCLRVFGNRLFSPRILRGRNAARACREAVDDAAFELRRALNIASALPVGAALLVISDFYTIDISTNAFGVLPARFDCTALIARDPWFAGLPLRGFARVRDAESGRSELLFIGNRERRRYREAVAERERHVVDRLTERGWRTGLLEEANGAAALRAAFGVA